MLAPDTVYVYRACHAFYSAFVPEWDWGLWAGITVLWGAIMLRDRPR